MHTKNWNFIIGKQNFKKKRDRFAISTKHFSRMVTGDKTEGKEATAGY